MYARLYLRFFLVLGAFFIARIYATFVAASFYLKMFTFMTFLARPDPPVPPILTRPLAIQCQRQQQPAVREMAIQGVKERGLLGGKRGRGKNNVRAVLAIV